MPTTVIMESISEQAARWVVRADAAPLNPEDQRALDAWLNADPRHRGAYIRARARWGDLDRLGTLHGPANSAMEEIASLPRVSRRQLLAASAAGIAVLGGGISWLVLRERGERYLSGIGEVRRIALEDGSTMLLNTDSEVRVRLGKAERSIRLIRGEAIFEVAHDKSRPFVVRVNESAVRAVGTAFAVRLEAAQIDVTVTEGVVEVGNSSSDQSAPMEHHAEVRRVTANQRLIIAGGRASNIQAVTDAEAARQLAWRDGMVSFDGESLLTAVNEINRHNRRQIAVEDSVLAAKPIVGSFRATDPEAFCAAAAAVLKARTTRDGNLLRLVPAATPAAH